MGMRVTTFSVKQKQRCVKKIRLHHQCIGGTEHGSIALASTQATWTYTACCLTRHSLLSDIQPPSSGLH